MNQSFGNDDIDIQQTETVFHGFFRVLRYRLRHKLFNGAWGEPIARELFARGDSVGVLLYDPERDCVALVQQFRIGCLDNAQGAWMWEVVAGMVKPGEQCTDVAVREVQEETGLAISTTQLRPICRYYSSPGGSDERLQLFCALRALPDGIEGVHGLAEEGEDIRIQCFSTKQALAALATGQINNAATVIALQWLQIHRCELRAGMALSATE